MSNETPNARPVVLDEDSELIDALTWYERNRKLTTRDIREGMVLVCEDGFAHAILDHRIGAIGGGNVAWLAQMVDTGRWERVTFPTTRVPTIRVAAA